jgi:hypothetical protein
MKKQKGLDWLDRNLLVSPYHYALCLSEEAYEKELDRLKVPKKTRGSWMKTPHADATLHFFEQNDDVGLCAIVCLRKKKGVEREQVYAMLVHEAVHLWQAIKEYIGELTPGIEAEAYSVQRVAQSLMYSYKEQTEKKKKKF